jgi:hypothetical protein
MLGSYFALCYSGAARALQGCCKSITRELQGCYNIAESDPRSFLVLNLLVCGLHAAVELQLAAEVLQILILLRL